MLERKNSINVPELLAPAGNWECARAAVENGADAIYFGLDQFNARMRADNFTVADLPELMKFLHQRGVKGYLAFNTLVFTPELPKAEAYLRQVIAAGVDAAILQDIGICRLIRHLSRDFPIHASTQMTITSAAGVDFARSLGCNLVVLARECSIPEITRIGREVTLPLEVFVHGALCVAYSGQCLTSEALGGRSANRGECAQACRMPYGLIVDDVPIDLGNRSYLLSPQDLAGISLLPQLIASGVASLKIEGRLKTPEYVAAVTQTYRRALDRIVSGEAFSLSKQEHYTLEMAFSRGLYTGWLQGIDNQALVHGEYAKKRGVYLGSVDRVAQGKVWIELKAPLKPGDGILFTTDRGEVGGRVYGVVPQGKFAAITLGRNDISLKQIHRGDRVWKTSDPALEQSLRQTFRSEYPQCAQPIHLTVSGEVGKPLIVVAQDTEGNTITVRSEQTLQPAQTHPLDTTQLCRQLGRLGNTPLRLETLDNHLKGAVVLPISALNHLRRQFVSQLLELRGIPRSWHLAEENQYTDLLPDPKLVSSSLSAEPPQLIALVRSLAQLQVVVEKALPIVYCELEDPRKYRQAVELVRQNGGNTRIWVAPPRITKSGEYYILEQVLSSGADGYLVRNYDHLQFFASYPMVGDFSLNVANPLTFNHFREQFSLQRITASYDLNIDQLEALVKATLPSEIEVTIHQHMPMFHMEHCVFCAFLSQGTDYTNCGRPCEKHEVLLRDRAGAAHVLRADAGCRNTVFNGIAQTGAEYVQRLLKAGVRYFRIEFLQESPTETLAILAQYQDLLAGKISGTQLWRSLRLQNQLGVTRGTIDGDR